MKDIYKNSPKIVEFMNKAQQKIAEITSLMVKRNNREGQELALELIDFIESLDNEWCHLTEQEIDVIIEYYNTKADLNSIPFLQLVGYQTLIITGNVGNGGGPWSVWDLYDYVFETNKLIGQMKHNNLKEIQGGRPGEYYHLTKLQWERLTALVVKEPEVGITLLNTTPGLTNGVFERGNIMTGFRVKGWVILNDGGVHTNSRYLLNNVLGVDYEGPENIDREWEYVGAVSNTSVVTFQALFTQASMKSASLTLRFELPYYSALDLAGRTFEQLTLTKHLSARSGIYNIDWSPPVGNGVEGKVNPVFPYVAFPAEWGLPQSIGADGSFQFDYINSFRLKQIYTKTLGDGTTANYNLFEYVRAFENHVTFNFKF